MRLFLLPLFCCVLAFSGTRGVFQPPHLGTAGPGYSGGGFSSQTGVGALLHNPGGLHFGGDELEAGLMAFESSFSPYLLFGSRANAYTTYGLGFFRDARSGDFQGMVGGFSFSPGDYMSAGATVTSQALEQNFGIDLDVGAVYRMHPWLRGGLAGKRLLESGLGQTPEGWETRRSYHASLGLIPFAWERVFLNYDWQGKAFIRPSMWAHAGSIEGYVGPQRNLGVTTSLRRGSSVEGGQLSMGFSGSLLVPLGFHQVQIVYALENLPLSRELEASAHHSFSVRIGLGGRTDRMPPEVEASLDRAVLVPSDTGYLRQVHFRLSATDNAGAPESWYLVLCRADGRGEPGEVVRSFAGKGLPPRTIRWEGRDSRREFLPPGYYAYRFLATDKAQNLSRTEWQLLEIK